MKRACFRLIAALIFALAAIGTAVSQTNRDFYYSVSWSGFTSSLFASAEYASISGSIEARRGKSLDLALSAHVMFPVNPFDLGESLAGMSVDFTPFVMLNHPFAWVSPRKMAYAPMLSASAWMPLVDRDAPLFILSIAPLRFFSGDGYFSVGGFGLVFDEAFSPKGWSATLFQFSHYIYGRRSR